MNEDRPTLSAARSLMTLVSGNKVFADIRRSSLKRGSNDSAWVVENGNF